ncbi:hypothetical protein ACJMK2_037564 [Sinanodonta woodiana]|uniref:hypoxia-inducible factor-proline dioxygenase n=1 Tax=Sinanodonta woodiana TaxID=1069815 RepID=A0ABD3WM76_SINWO
MECELCGAFENLLLCGGCRSTWYCCKEHQKTHWKNHKVKCQPTRVEQHNNDFHEGQAQKFNLTKSKKGVSCDDSSASTLSQTADDIVTQKIGYMDITPKKYGGEMKHEDVDVIPDVIRDDGAHCGESFKTSPREITHADHGDAIDKTVETLFQSGTSRTSALNIRQSEGLATYTKSSDEGDSSNSENILAESVNTVNIIAQEGSSERYILQSEETKLYTPNYMDSALKRRTMAPNNGMKADSEIDTRQTYLQILESRNKELGEYVVRCLNSYGVCVVDNFLGESKGTDILNEVQALHKKGKLTRGQLVNMTTSNTSIRGDIITWVDGSEDGCSNINFLVSCMDAIIIQCQNRLDKYNINGRTKAMVACYPGQTTGFLRHVDNPNGDGRCVTCIYYSNKDWNVMTDGGLLRIFPEGQNRVANVEPKFDRLLFFWSDRRNPHEVQPAFRTRYAITVWYYDADERKRAVKRFKDSHDKRGVQPLLTTKSDFRTS